MDTIFLKVKIKKSDKTAEMLRDQGHFFDAIADSLDIDREQIVEIDDANLANSVKELKEYWCNDKG